MDLTVYTLEGQPAGAKSLSDEIVGIEPNDHAIYLDARLILANKRQGTHKTKERGEVSGSNKKPWRQKGTGNARAGHKRSPLWRHGGTIFGPRPHKYGFKVNKKVKLLARKSALAYKAKEDCIFALQYPAFSGGKGQTKAFVKMLEALNLKGEKTLFVTGKDDSNFYYAGRNIEGVLFAHAAQLNTYDVINARRLVLIEDAVDVLNEILTKK